MIVEATLRSDATIKTEITSGDMSVAPPGAIFIEKTVVDEFGENGRRGEGEEHLVVAGTMEIGLLQRSGCASKIESLERDLVEPKGESGQ